MDIDDLVKGHHLVVDGACPSCGCDGTAERTREELLVQKGLVIQRDIVQRQMDIEAAKRQEFYDAVMDWLAEAHPSVLEDLLFKAVNGDFNGGVRTEANT